MDAVHVTEEPQVYLFQKDQYRGLLGIFTTLLSQLVLSSSLLVSIPLKEAVGQAPAQQDLRDSSPGTKRVLLLLLTYYLIYAN